MSTKGKRLRPRSRYNMDELMGKRVGTRVIIGRGPNTKSNNHTVIVRCDCGNERAVETAKLLAGRYQTCIECAKDRQTGSLHPGWKGGRYISKTLYEHWRMTALRRKIAWDVSIEFLDELLDRQQFRCALSGVILVIGHGQENGAVLGNISLDRIDSSKGYQPGNVHFVTKAVNIGKQSLSIHEFIEMCKQVAEYTRGKET